MTFEIVDIVVVVVAPVEVLSSKDRNAKRTFKNIIFFVKLLIISNGTI